LLAFLLRGDEDIGGLVAIGFGQHAWLPLKSRGRT
jgi:hypothetical protein